MRGQSRIAIGAVVAALLGGCAADPADGVDVTPTPSATPEVSESETPSAGSSEFAMPETCVDVVSAATLDGFAATRRELLGGPGGLYGEHYFGEPTPEERAGGITCVWGDEAAPASTVIVSVAPVTPGTQSEIVKALIANGLVESQIEGALTYARIGDEVSAPAELHVVRTTSWISVIEAVGGTDRFEHATDLASDVARQVYVAD